MHRTFSLVSAARGLSRRLGVVTGSALGTVALASAMLAPAPVTQAQGSPIANPCESTIQTLPFVLDFKSEKGCVQDRSGKLTGFTAYQPNDATKGVTAYQPNLIALDTAAGTLTLTSTATISGNQVFGSLSRNDNTQVNALEAPFDASALGGTTTKVFTITARLKGDPVSGLSQINVAREQAAVYFGPDQDNYVKLAIIGGKPEGTSIEFIDELRGQIGELQGPKLSLVSVDAISRTIQTLDLMLVGDQEAGKISAYFAVDGGAAQKMPYDVTLSAKNAPSVKDIFFNNGTQPDTFRPSRAGVLVTNKNNIGPVTVAFSGFSIIDARRPSADAGPDQSVVTNNLVTLDGKGYVPADNPARTIASYNWSLTGSTGTFTSTPTLSGTLGTRTFLAPSGSGTLTYTLVVVDSAGGVSTPDSVRIVVNETPISSVRVDVNSPTSVGQPTTFTATANDQATNVSYSWDFGDGEIGAGQTVVHTYDFVGTYTATVVASNSTGSFTQTALVTVKNDPPVANAGANQEVQPGAAVTLDGSASTDPDGHTPLSYSWSQVGGVPVTLSNATAANPTFTAPVTPSFLLFSLVVTDSRGLVSVTPAVVTIKVGDPAVNGLTISTSSPTVLGGTTFFTGTATLSGNVTYSWSFGDGATGAGANVSHVYGAEGNYVATLTATNSVSTTVGSVFVRVTNTAPTANAGADRTVEGDTLVTLSATGADPDNHLPLTYSWKQLNGSLVTLSGSGATRTFTAPKLPGTLLFELTVTDGRGKSTTDTVLLTVTKAKTKLYLPVILKIAP